MINETGSIKLRNSPGRPRTARTKDMIRKVKQRLNRKKRLSIKKLEKELCISDSIVHRILTINSPYAIILNIIHPIQVENFFVRK